MTTNPYMSVDLNSEYPLYNVPEGILRIVGGYVIPDPESEISSLAEFKENQLAHVFLQTLGNLSERPKLMKKEHVALSNRAEMYQASSKIAFWKALPGGAEAIVEAENEDEVALSASLREWIRENLSNVRSLHLTRLKFIPDEIEEMKNLRELTIFSNKLAYISPALASLSKLKVLKIDSQGLKDFPELSGLSGTLTDLEIRSRFLASIPDGLASMKKLRRLELCAPKVPYGKVLGELQKLRKLKLKEVRLFLNPYWCLEAMKIKRFHRFTPGIMIESEARKSEYPIGQSVMRLQQKK